MNMTQRQIDAEIDSLTLPQIEAIARRLGEDPGEFFIRVVGGVGAFDQAQDDTSAG